MSVHAAGRFDVARERAAPRTSSVMGPETGPLQICSTQQAAYQTGGGQSQTQGTSQLARRDRQRQPAALRLHLLGAGIEGFEARSEEHTSELQSHSDLVCRLLLEKKNSATTP